MLKQLRYDKIFNHLNEQGYLTVDEAVVMLGLSRSTVCRDFKELAKMNLVQRSHGGVSLLKKKDNGIIPYPLRQVKNIQEKKAIARRAASLLTENDTVFLDGGTTTLQIASCIPTCPLTVITNSLHHASLIIENQGVSALVEVFIAGGYVYAPWHVNIGPQTRYCLSQYHARWTFLSARGIDEGGIYNHNELIVEAERTMIQNTEKVVLLADHTKFNERSVIHLCDLREIDILITDEWKENQKILDVIRNEGVEVITVQP